MEYQVPELGWHKQPIYKFFCWFSIRQDTRPRIKAISNIGKSNRAREMDREEESEIEREHKISKSLPQNLVIKLKNVN